MLKTKKKRNNLVLKWTKDLNSHLTKENVQIAHKYVKRCSKSYVIKEMLIKTTVTYHDAPIREAKLPNTDNAKRWGGCGATGTLTHCLRGYRMVLPL